MKGSRAVRVAFLRSLVVLRFDLVELLEISERAERFLSFLHGVGQRDQRRGLGLELRSRMRGAVGLSRAPGALKRPPLRRPLLRSGNRRAAGIQGWCGRTFAGR